MADRHVMVTEATLPHGWTLQCPDCPRRMFFYRTTGLWDTIDRGDFDAQHSWGTPGLSIGASLEVSDG